MLIDSTGLPNSSRLPVTAISNHNGEINNEVRLIYVVQRGTGLPIYMRYVSGNIVDVSTLLTTIAELKAMKVDTKFAILDAGYLTLDSIDVLLENKISFLSRLK
ncbi:transposase, partial [Anaerobiospirillum succiniciproducens]|uniref:transposase n=1 Tax=Anaerobiospirillum succiniciproducens TaxID=13335 RepID=UPI003F8A1B3F